MNIALPLLPFQWLFLIAYGLEIEVSSYGYFYTPSHYSGMNIVHDTAVAEGIGLYWHVMSGSTANG